MVRGMADGGGGGGGSIGGIGGSTLSRQEVSLGGNHMRAMFSHMICVYGTVGYREAGAVYCDRDEQAAQQYRCDGFQLQLQHQFQQTAQVRRAPFGNTGFFCSFFCWRSSCLESMALLRPAAGLGD